MEFDRIFLLALKKSKNYDDVTYCIGVHRLGTPGMEFIIGETDNDRQYNKGDEVTYVFNADFTSSLHDALNWLNNVK